MNYSFKIRFVTSDGDENYVMAEMPPHERMMFAYGHRGLRVSLPWMVFVVPMFTSEGFEPWDLYTYIRNKPLRSIGDKLVVPSFANTGKDGGVCLGNAGGGIHESVEGAVASQIEAYFSTVFVSDAGMRRRPNMRSGHPISDHLPWISLDCWKEWTQS
jgi:hypothetical protein